MRYGAPITLMCPLVVQCVGLMGFIVPWLFAMLHSSSYVTCYFDILQEDETANLLSNCLESSTDGVVARHVSQVTLSLD